MDFAGSFSTFGPVDMPEGKTVGVSVCSEEALVGLSSCPWAVPLSSYPSTLQASYPHQLMILSMSLLMSSAVMRPMLGSMHWTVAFLSSFRGHWQCRKRLSIDLTATSGSHRWQPACKHICGKKTSGLVNKILFLSLFCMQLYALYSIMHNSSE